MATSTEVRNFNSLSPVGFSFVLERIPNTIWNIQEISIPGVSLGDSSRSVPTGKSAIPGDTLQYDELSITFVVDESMNNWRELYNWMRGLAPTHIGIDRDNQYKILKNNRFGLLSDGELIIMTNSGNENIRYKFKDLFPLSLSSISLNTTSTSIDPITATISFQYTNFDIVIYDSNSIPGNTI